MSTSLEVLCILLVLSVACNNLFFNALVGIMLIVSSSSSMCLIKYP